MIFTIIKQSSSVKNDRDQFEIRRFMISLILAQNGAHLSIFLGYTALKSIVDEYHEHSINF